MLPLLFLHFLVFLILVFLFIYLPGFLLISTVKKDLNREETISFSLTLGSVLLVLVAVVFGITNIRILALPAILLLSLISILKFKKSIFSPWNFIQKKTLLILIILGILVQGFINFPSGYKYDDGLLFWSSQAFDGFWHISLIEEIKKAFPPQMPTFPQERLINYHYLSDIFMGEFARIFPFFSSLDLYFRFFPVFFSFLMGINIFAFVNRWKNKTVAYWALFFTYFTGSFGYIFTYLRDKELFAGETAFWVSQLNTVIANPPHAMAISLLMAFLLAFLFFLESRKVVWFFIAILCAFMIAGFKVSAGVVLLAGLAVAAVVDFVKNRKSFLIGFLLIILGISNFITIKLMTKGVEGYLIFSPWWFIRTMVVEKLGWIDWELRRQHYVSKGTWQASLRVLQLETMAFFIFLVGNLGMRVIGFVEVFKGLILKKYSILKSPIDLSIFTMMLTAFLIPLFFLQKGIASNTVQFIQYFLLFFGFYAAITTVGILGKLRNNGQRLAFISLVIILSIPTVIGNFVEFYGPGRTPLAVVSNNELEALEYLKTHSKSEDIVLSPSFNKHLKDKYTSQPFPIYAWYSTGYISGLTSRRTYLALDDMVIQTGLDYEGRVSKVNNFFDQNDVLENSNFLIENEIKYIYVPKAQIKMPLDLTVNKLDLLYENSEVIIYKVKLVN